MTRYNIAVAAVARGGAGGVARERREVVRWAVAVIRLSSTAQHSLTGRMQCRQNRINNTNLISIRSYKLCTLLRFNNSIVGSLDLIQSVLKLFDGAQSSLPSDVSNWSFLPAGQTG